MASTVIPLRQTAVERSLKQAAFEHAGVPIFCVNASGQILALNAEAATLVGGDSPVGRSIAELLAYPGHSAFSRRWTRLWADASASNEARVETKLPLRLGGSLSARILIRPFRFEQDEYAVVVVSDTSKERSAARQSRLADARVNTPNNALFVQAVAPVWKQYEDVFGKDLFDLIEKARK